MRYLFIALFMIAAMVHAHARSAGSNAGIAPFTIVSPAFYVSATGSDGNAGTFAAPFATLGKAQTAMRGSGTKFTYVRGGTYTSLPQVVLAPGVGPTQATVMLTSADNGVTYSYYPPDGVDSAVFNGNSSSLCENTTSALDYGIWIEGGSNITINGLAFTNYTFGGIGLHGGVDYFYDWYDTGGNGAGTADSDLIENNLMQNIYNGSPTTTGICTSPAMPPPLSSLNDSGGGVTAMGQVTNLTITHNAIIGTLGSGMDLEMFATTDSMSGLTVSYNYISNVNQQENDQGCVHLYNYTGSDASQGALTSAHYTNNYIHDCGGSNSSSPYGSTRGIYVDDGASHVTVTGNIVAGHMAECFNYHGGNNNTVSGNICDLGDGALGAQQILEYQDDAFCSGSGCMANNTYHGNIVISNSSTAMGGYNTFITGSNALSASDDLSYAYSSGGITDSASVSTSNPLLSGWTYTLGAGSPAFSSPINFPAQPSNWGQAGYWGPPGFVIPHTGTPPSNPH